MAYLIDGNNLIGHMFPQNIRDVDSKYRLIGQLYMFHAVERSKVHLVFDGPPVPSLEQTDRSKDPVRIYFPDYGQKADDIIKKIILKVTDKRRYYVVSSDRDIKDFARRNGLRVLTSPQFFRDLKKIKREFHRINEEKKEDIPLSRLEVEHWRDLFEKKR